MKKVKTETIKGKRGSAYRSEFLARFSSELGNWEEGTLKERLCGEVKPRFRTYSGTLVGENKPEFRSGSGEFITKRVYTPIDIANADPLEEIGLPGQYPFTRGRDPVG